VAGPPSELIDPGHHTPPYQIELDKGVKGCISPEHRGSNSIIKMFT